ncbi:MAG: spondin domain-containing protein [Synechococcales bacterium]|nr:spondin domain-containing protein [Synechococcales bacterium]
MTTFNATIEVTNLSPENGAFLTPLWFGFHDGGFDTYDRGRPSSPGLESLAEDGATELISQEFDLAGFGTLQGTILGTEGTPGPIDPGETATFGVVLDSADPTHRFFSYASMVIPSNDFFIANGSEIIHPILDRNGNFIGADFIVLGGQVLDAGTEVDDEIPANTAFFGQQAPNTGVDENGVIVLSEGFIPNGPILSDPRFANADFTAPGFEVVRIRVLADNPIFPTAAPVTLSSNLSGDQEVPTPTGSDAIGFSSLTLNETGDALTYSLTISGLDFGEILGIGAQTEDPNDDVTRIHIHDGDRGVNGPVAFGLIDLVAPELNGQDADDFTIVQNNNGSVTLSGVWEQTDDAAIALSQFVSEIRNAEPGEDIGLYWNVHTEGFPGGEIRGQLQEGVVNPPPLPGIQVNGSGSNDRLQGTDGNDLIRGRGGDDRLVGGDGDDVLIGNNGDDRLVGNGGNDLLNGGRGRDVMIGGPGDDTYVLINRDDNDLIRGFGGGDRLELAGNLSFGNLTITQDGRNTLISNGDNLLATLRGVDASTITESVFV